MLEHQTRLPRELLQSGLRPILTNLADPKRLSIGGLEGLGRLLKLLTNYFKVEIGAKLLDHFRYIADPQMLRNSARLPLSDNEAIMKLVRLVDIFHLLPSAANVFLRDLVDAVVLIESQLNAASQTPFSEPLGKFLDRYPSESVDFFFRCINKPRHVRTLRNLLQAKTAMKLHKELISRSKDIADICLRRGDDNAILAGLLLCSDLIKLSPGWTKGNEVIDALLDLWRTESQRPIDDVAVPHELAQRWRLIVTILMKALEESPRIDIIFDIISIYSRHATMELGDFTRFIYHHIAINGSLFYRRNILLRFLTWFDDPSVSWSTKTYFLRYVLSPMIVVHATRTRDEGLLDRFVLGHFHDRIWKRMSDSASFTDADDLFKIEVLYMTTVMVRFCPKLLNEAKKDIIKCAWAYITSEDSLVKQTAYLLAARFFEAFPTPPKFILRVWTGLLKPPHSEGRALVKQALDILPPVLQKMPSEPGLPNWAVTTRRLLAEEGNGLSQIILIYQLIVRQPDLFYPYRALFIPHMVNSLGKLGLLGSATSESRLLSLDILAVIYSWEQKSSKSDENQSGWVTPLGFRETMVSYLVRISTAMQDAQSRGSYVPRALALLKEFLGASGWNDVTFKLDFFRKALDQVSHS